MMFDVAADAYGAYMGRWSEPLAPEFLATAGLRPGHRALDVGCGPGALTAPLVQLLGEAAVSAVDPSASFVAAVRTRFPTLDVRLAGAEALPFDDATFDAALAQLVVHFMEDPAVGLREMARVTRPGGRVAACVWDHAGTGGPLAAFWRAVRDTDPTADDESTLAGTARGDLTGLLRAAGLSDVRERLLTVRVAFADLEDWWHPFTLGVGPGGRYVARLDDAGRAALRARCAALLPVGAFELEAAAWSAVGRVPRPPG